jgi:DNA-binding transcriptional ArsR family regulator
MFSLPKPYPVDLRELSYDGIRLLPKMKAEPVKTLKPGSPQMARRIVTKYFSDGRGFTLKKYLICLDKEGYMVSKDTARRDLKKLEKAGLVRIDRRKSPHNFIYLGKERYNKLAQRVVPLLLEEADTRSLLRVLPREGTREIDTAGLLRQIKEDSKGSIAAQILDVFLCDNALSVANIPKGIKLKEYEIEIIKDAVLRLNRQKLKGQLSDVIDKIMTEFGDDLGEVIVRTSLARLLNEAEGQIDTNYILVDIDRLDAGKFNDVSKIIERLNQLKLDSKKFVKIVWSSHRIKSYEELKGFVEGLFGKKDLEGDIFVSNPDELLPERFVGRLMQILEAKHIPIYEIVGLIAPENSHIYAGLEIVKRSFQKVKITLSPVEYEQLKPFLPEGMDSYIKYEDGCYTIEFNTLEDNLTEIIELLKQGQENLSHMA